MSRLKEFIRRTTATLRSLPDYLILGTQKGGTTSVYEYLNRHPQIVPNQKREVHFFDLAWQKDLQEYRRYFPLRRQMRIRAETLGKPALTGESSPYYLFHPHCPRRIYDTLPEAKLIVVLRDPVDRAYSHFTHNRRKGRERRSFAEAVREEMETLPAEIQRIKESPDTSSDLHRQFSYVHRGFYSEQVRRYLDLFPREALHAVRSEDLFRKPRETMDAVCAFLGIEPMPETIEFTAYNRQAYAEEAEPETRAYLRELYAPHNKDLEQLLQRPFNWQ